MRSWISTGLELVGLACLLILAAIAAGWVGACLLVVGLGLLGVGFWVGDA